jgi:hypothetical protein
MGHDIKDTLYSYRLTAKQLFIAFYTTIIKRDYFFHILRFKHFSDNMNQPDKNDNNCVRLLKMRSLFD